MNTIQDYAKRLRAAADVLDGLHGTPKPQPTLKDELLAHYATGTPTFFKQFDGFMPETTDSFFADADGHSIFISEDFELRNSNHAVRVQIKSGTPPAAALALLKKIVADVETTIEHEGESVFNLRPLAFKGCTSFTKTKPDWAK